MPITGAGIIVGGSGPIDVPKADVFCPPSPCICDVLFPYGAPSTWILNASTRYTCSTRNGDSTSGSDNPYCWWFYGIAAGLLPNGALAFLGGCENAANANAALCGPAIALQVGFNMTTGKITAIAVLLLAPGFAQWSASAAQLSQLNCSTPMTLGNLIVNDGGACAAYPATVTITPVAKTNVGMCLGLACDFQVTIAGITNIAGCTDSLTSHTTSCVAANGTFTLGATAPNYGLCTWDNTLLNQSLFFQLIYGGSHTNDAPEPAVPIPDCQTVGVLISLGATNAVDWAIVPYPAQAQAYALNALGGTSVITPQ
jgi:hypothetical protein